MEILNFLLIFTFFIVSACIVATLDYKEDIDFVKAVFFVVTALLCAVSILNNTFKLKEQDVFNGRAEYVETIHISKGDTIKTYHIQLKK